MYILKSQVLSNTEITKNTFVLEILAPEISSSILPGQFINIKVSDNSFPLLRRPFSVCDVIDNSIFIMYKVIGEGTRLMSEKKNGDILNILGPLGNSFSYEDNIDHVFLLGGGIGIAPFPYLIKSFTESQKYSTIFGVRNEEEVHDFRLKNILYSSDDGSIGFNGNAIQLLETEISKLDGSKVKIYACGPNPMLRALQNLLKDKGVDCEVSMESAMACGFGICQGCPIDHNEDERYKLICKDGPIFNIRDIKI